MSKLIIICGQSGSGKTTLGNALSIALQIPCISKDSIKERLYEVRKLGTLENSLEIGKESIQMLLDTANKIVSKQQDLIIEAKFTYSEDYKIFQSWIDNHQTQIYSIICQIDQDTRKFRFYSRERHPAHHDLERIYTPQDDKIYESIPGKKIYVTTNQPIEVLIQKLAPKLK